jgi:molybdopterin-binding protein
MAGLELVNLIKQFPGFTIGPVSLKVGNEIRVIIGPTGSGKTTILNLISGLIKPDCGSIFLDDNDITNYPIERREIGYIFQKPLLFPHLSVYDNIIFGRKKCDSFSVSEIRKLLDDLGIGHLSDRRIQGLSGGEMQKASLARMLVTKPKIILMDEPLANLDDQSKKKLRLDLRQVLKERNLPTIYVTHFEQDVYALADRISLLYNGKVLYDNTLNAALTFQDPNSFPFRPEIFSAEGNYIEGVVTYSSGGVTIFKYHTQTLQILGDYPLGSNVGILIRPEDIIISKDLVKTSARNFLRIKIVNVTKPIGATGMIRVHMLLEQRLRLVAKITDEARIELGIEDGDMVYAIFKASSPQVVREGNSH